MSSLNVCTDRVNLPLIAMFRHLPILSFCVFLVACATPPPTPAVSALEPAEEPPVAIEPIEKPIPAGSVYPLLVAEFALRRGAYDVALENYLEQSRQLEEPDVRAQATRLAQFMRRDPEALASAQLWVQADPDNIEANNVLATLLIRGGRPTEALPYLAVVTRSGEQAQYPMLLKGFRTMTPAQQAELVQGINQMAVEFPEDTQILITQALIHDELGQPDQALNKLERVFAEDPHQPQAVLLEAKLLLDSDAKKPFQRLEATLAEDPDNSRLRLQYARLLTRTDIEGARAQFKILHSQSPGDGDLLFSLALISRETNNPEQARNYLQQMLKLGLRTDEAHYYLGRIAEEEANLNEAVAQYKQVESGGDFMNANNRIGYILLGADEGARLHGYMSQLRNKYPDQREALYALQVDLLNRSQNTVASMALVNEALEEYPQSTALLYSRSIIAEQQDNLALMESDLRSIIAKEPDNASALNALGYSLANRTERYDEAYPLIVRALELQPDEPAILDSMGWILYRQGSYPEALEFLSRAYIKFPDPEVAAHLGEVLWVTGETDAAVDVWRGAMLKDPDHKILKETLERLGVTTLTGTIE
ncbi:MAG: tetratricopeptide repeat protein [Halioglobus sp.]